MKKIHLILLTVLFTVFSTIPQRASAQISRGEWSFSPVVTVTNNVYGMAYGLVINTTSQAPWMPDVETRFAMPQSLETPNGKAKISYWDWELRNIAAGYRVTYMSKTSPFGFSFRVNYEKRGLRTTLPEGILSSTGSEEDGKNPNYRYFNRQTISPELLLRLRIGNYINSTYNGIVELGGSYNFAVACKGLSKSTKSINDGFRGVIGGGIGNTETHFQITLRYEYDFYNWFNEKWSNDGINHPYKGWKFHTGAIMLNVRYGF